MVRIWAKLIQKEKIIRDFMLEKDERFTIVNFPDYVEEICYNLDVPTPVMLKYHINNYFRFNNARFTPADFVERVNFEALILENAVID